MNKEIWKTHPLYTNYAISSLGRIKSIKPYAQQRSLKNKERSNKSREKILSVKAGKSNPYLYVSLHHNYYDVNSTGYFSMYNQNDAVGKAFADRLSNAISNNGQVPMRASRANDGYIGELNVINKTTTPVLLELGFFSNIEELEKICSDSYVQYVSTQLANEITSIIKNK